MSQIKITIADNQQLISKWCQTQERSYNSLREMAHENAYSRMLMGVHYKQDCDEGLRLGYEVADIINQTDFKSILVKDNYHL